MAIVPSPPLRTDASWLRCEPLQRMFRIYEGDEEDLAVFRARQLQAVLRLSPLALTVNIGNAVLLVTALWNEAPHGFLLAWAGFLTALALWASRGWWTSRSTATRPMASARALRKACWHAGLLGLAWAVLPAVTFGGLDMNGKLLVAVITTGMICAGGCMLAPVPWASTAFTLIVGTGAMVALSSWDAVEANIAASLLGLYVVVVLCAAWAQAATLGARMQAEAQAARQSELIGLLLRDVEDQGRDLLWELEARGRFAKVPPRLGRALGVDAARLQGLRAGTLVQRMLPQNEHALNLWHALERLLATKAPFRDALLLLGPADAPRWWSLSARPLLSARGHLTGWRGVATDVTDKQVAHLRLQWLAHNDALTGLVNRNAFHEELQTELALRGARAPALAIATFDLDGFKQTNDTYGHAVGDLLLQAVGQRLMAVARSGDTVARLGGDEFAMLIRGVNAESQVEPFLQQVLDKLQWPLQIDGLRLTVRASMGVAFAPRDGTEVDPLLTRADLALYSAKRAGGSCFQVFKPHMAEANKRRVALEQSLRGAIGRCEFTLVYQPQVSATDYHLHGFEALLRWHHPEFGEVPPEEFICIAEQSGLMPGIGAWVLEQACHEARSWPAHVRLSVNVSATQLSAPGFVDLALAACAHMPAGRVELEITETALIDDADAVVSVLTALRTMGYRIALDDFGTGFSALGYLRLFRFDTLKIDKRFVRDLALNSEAQIIVDTIVAMAGALKMATVAEGVESCSEAGLLERRGCDLLQGYLISCPLVPAAATAFWQEWEPPIQAMLRH